MRIQTKRSRETMHRRKALAAAGGIGPVRLSPRFASVRRRTTYLIELARQRQEAAMREIHSFHRGKPC